MMDQSKEEVDVFDFLEKDSPENTHRLFWAELYDRLIETEARSIYSIMEKASFRPGQAIYRQGAFSRNLYFFEQGQAKHIFTHHGRDVFIKKVKAGSIAGECNFFDGGCCTTTLVAMDPVKVRVMSAVRLKEEIRYYDVLEGRLRSFCAKEEKILDLLNRNAQDRRHHNRLSLKGSVLIMDVDRVAGLNVKSLKGEIKDVSSGGMAVVVKLVKKDQAQALLGNSFKVLFNLPPKMTAIERTCQVLGVRWQEDEGASLEDRNKYMLNIKFSEPVATAIITECTRHVKMFNNIHR